MPSIDPKPIEQQSKRSGSNQNFNCIFDKSKNRFDRQKIQKTQIFEKQSNFLQKLLKALKFMNKMHEYEMKCFSKNTCFEPNFPKMKIFNQFSLNYQASNTFCINFKEFSNLVGQTKITHNNMYRVQQRLICIVCATSKNLKYM